MKAVKRRPAHKVWRQHHDALRRVSLAVSKAVEALEDEKVLAESGLPDLIVRLNRELRDNALAELRWKREDIELREMEITDGAKVRILRQIEAKIASRLEDMIALEDLRSLLAPDRPPKSAVTDPATVTPEGNPTPVGHNADGQPADDKTPEDQASGATDLQEALSGPDDMTPGETKGQEPGHPTSESGDTGEK